MAGVDSSHVTATKVAGRRSNGVDRSIIGGCLPMAIRAASVGGGGSPL